MRRVAKGLVELASIEDLVVDYAAETDPEAGTVLACKIADKADWLLNRLLEFMDISAALSLNQKDNDEATLYKMRLEGVQARVMDASCDWK